MLVSLAISLLLLFVGFKLKVFRVDLASIPVGLWLVASIHFVFIKNYINSFSPVGEFTYQSSFFLVLAGIISGAYIWKRLTGGTPEPLGRLPRRAENSIIVLLCLTVIAFNAVIYVYGYYQKTGTLNPLAGISSMFSGENRANEMWSGSGGSNYGDSRGSSAGDMGGGFIAYFARWFSLLPLLCLGLLGRKLTMYVAIPYFAVVLLSISGGYSSRTAIVTWMAIFVFLVHENIRRFRKLEIIMAIVAVFFLVMVLHMARLGTIATGDSAKVVMENLEQASIDTFEPVGWAFIAWDNANYTTQAKISHCLSYVGALIPRFLWPSKPHYSFEPDLTMLLTQRDISGMNPVRTFTIAGEGFILGGMAGVYVIACLYTLTALAVVAVLSRYYELTLVRYWFIATVLIMFRTSLFSLASSALVLCVGPVFVMCIARRVISGKAVWPRIVGYVQPSKSLRKFKNTPVVVGAKR